MDAGKGAADFLNDSKEGASDVFWKAAGSIRSEGTHIHFVDYGVCLLQARNQAKEIMPCLKVVAKCKWQSQKGTSTNEGLNNPVKQGII